MGDKGDSEKTSDAKVRGGWKGKGDEKSALGEINMTDGPHITGYTKKWDQTATQWGDEKKNCEGKVEK